MTTQQKVKSPLRQGPEQGLGTTEDSLEPSF